VRISIVTPSFRAARWLPLCIASVADQEAGHEHIVQDAGSDDGTLDWLPRDRRVMAFVEKDEGMYDAINRGFRRSTGEILAWLNADEQYLPGTLEAVAAFFAQHPDVDFLFGDVVVVDANGGYLCSRQVLPPLALHTRVCHLATLSCAMFFRRRVLDEHNLWLDARWRSAGDAEWMLRVMEHGLKMAVLRRYLSVFTQTDSNLTLSPCTRREARQIFETAPRWAQLGWPLVMLHHRLRRLFNGLYQPSPFSYSLYTPASPGRRVTVQVSRPTFRWRNWG
jgi:glycosyltransferase involved in cell wall biosynthesis